MHNYDKHNTTAAFRPLIDCMHVLPEKGMVDTQFTLRALHAPKFQCTLKSDSKSTFMIPKCDECHDHGNAT